MGPSIIFDKSFLQCLNINEAVWLDQFYYANLTPLFYVEVLADLEKKIKGGWTPEHEVAKLAEKTPDFDVAANLHHRTILAGELSGTNKVDMETGRILVAGGRDTLADGQHGVVFEELPEEVAFNRWRQGDFLDVERQYAASWRQALSVMSSVDQERLFQGWYGAFRPRDLATVKREADKFIDGPNQRSVITNALSLLGVPPQTAHGIMMRWHDSGCPTLGMFAPYTKYVYGVDLFYYLARAAKLISSRKSNKVDIAYLYYLPFCMVFVSKDKLHRDVVPLFLRANQSFVWGEDLKEDLGQLDKHYSSLPKEVSSQALNAFAGRPPADSSFLTARLWDKHMRPNWRDSSTCVIPRQDAESNRETISMLENAASAPTVSSRQLDGLPEDPHHIILKKYVRSRKGKWRRIPPEAGNK